MKLVPALLLASLQATTGLSSAPAGELREKAPDATRTQADGFANSVDLKSPLSVSKADLVGVNPAAPAATSDDAADPGVSPEMIDLLADAVIAKLRAKPEILLDIILSYEERSKPAQRMIRPEDPALGPKDAEITLVHFFDPGCAPCRATATAVEQAAAADGKVRVVLKEFPTSSEGVAMSVNALAAKDYNAAHTAVLGGLTPPAATDKEAIAKASAIIAANRETAARFRVSVLPTVFAVGDGFAARMEGPLSVAQVTEKLKTIRTKASARAHSN
ncbi:thiol-disulfide isomerase/thioredoxin [Bradyrhizobium sp. USDA 4341]